MRHAEEFERAARERGITRWPLHNCSMCHYQCGFVFSDGQVAYDAGCYCSGGGLQPRTTEDVAAQYNMQRHPDVIAKYDAFWGFGPTEQADGN